MKKVLLVFDDFNEMTLTESFLKKVGFDALGITNERRLGDQILTFNPDVVVAFGKSQQVSSVSVASKLKEHRSFFGKVLVVMNKGARPTSQEMLKMKMDGVLEAPYTQERLIGVLGKLIGQETSSLLEKWAKLQKEAGNGEISFDDKKRQERYKMYIKDVKIDPQQTSHSREEVAKHHNELKKGMDFNQLEELDELKREFAEALFKKSKS